MYKHLHPRDEVFFVCWSLIGMNIRARIFARKIALVYFYERLFVQQTAKKEIWYDEIIKIGKAIEHEDDRTWTEQVAWYYDDIDEELAYIIQEHFAKLKPSEIDYTYLKKVLPEFDQALPWVRNGVNSRATTFKFDEMDLMTRVIFTLWVIESQQLWTPKQVLINEMVELAKRYGDATSPKLINGIAHYMFEEKEKSDLLDRVTKKK